MHSRTDAVDSPSRRGFLRHVCAAACTWAAAPAFSAEEPSVGHALRQLRRNAVQITGGPLLQQFNDQQDLFRGIADDALLKPFRKRAGLSAPGPDMGGWY